MSPVSNLNFIVVWSNKTDWQLNWRQFNIYFSSCCAIAILPWVPEPQKLKLKNNESCGCEEERREKKKNFCAF